MVIHRAYLLEKGHRQVAWVHGTYGTCGVNPERARSNQKHLWHDFHVVYQLTLNGYVIVATDYAGLGITQDANGKPIAHEYITVPAQGSDVLYSIKVAQAAFPEFSAEVIIIRDSESG